MISISTELGCICTHRLIPAAFLWLQDMCRSLGLPFQINTLVIMKLSFCVRLEILGSVMLRAAPHYLFTQVAVMGLALPAHDVIVIVNLLIQTWMIRILWILLSAGGVFLECTKRHHFVHSGNTLHSCTSEDPNSFKHKVMRDSRQFFCHFQGNKMKMYLLWLNSKQEH